jgi:hypothetical protein
MLRVAQNPPIKITREFQRVQERLRSMPRARSMQDIQRSGGVYNDPSSGGRYTGRVQPPSRRMRTYQGGSFVRVSVPDNWREFQGNSAVQFAPEGGYGEQGITHGIMMGVERSSGGSLQQATERYVQSLLQNNPYLRPQTGLTRASVAGKNAYAVTLAGRSPVTGSTEVVTIYTTPMRSGDLFYVAMVVPQDEVYEYNDTFRAILQSIDLNG